MSIYNTTICPGSKLIDPSLLCTHTHACMHTCICTITLTFNFEYGQMYSMVVHVVANVLRLKFWENCGKVAFI